ncbi:MAG: endonuclease domain-containing protein [Sphingomonadaceae bacterium]|nr:endonuclease domain-containing protein [Sphingomonadaceae bacterium]
MAGVILPDTGRGTAGEAGGGGGVRQARRPEVATARKLRRMMSLPEVLLWERLRGGSVGAKFRRQHPIGPYVVDFYCREGRLIVEVDGEVHNRGERTTRDAVREAFLRENGFRFFRTPAADVLRDPDAVAQSIAALVECLLHQPAAGPPPRAGEEL